MGLTDQLSQGYTWRAELSTAYLPIFEGVGPPGAPQDLNHTPSGVGLGLSYLTPSGGRAVFGN